MFGDFISAGVDLGQAINQPGHDKAARGWADQQRRNQNIWNLERSQTAYQVQMQSMRDAGLNPILAATQGAQASQGAGHASVPPTSGEPGRSHLRGMVASAMSAKNQEADLATKAGQAGALRAQAAASEAQAVQSLATAKATAAGLPRIQEESRSAKDKADADIAESRVRKVHGKYDEKWAPIDNAVNRVTGYIGNGAAAVGRIFRPSSGGDSWRKAPTMKRDNGLRKPR